MGINAYFNGVVVNNSTITGLGGAIIAALVTAIVVLLIAAVPVFILVVLFFALRRIFRPSQRDTLPDTAQNSREQPAESSYRLPQRMAENEWALQQQRKSPPPPEIQALLNARNEGEWKKSLSEIGHKGNTIFYGIAVAAAFMNEYGLSDKKAQEIALKASEVFGEASENLEEATKAWDRFLLHEQAEEDIPFPLRQRLKSWQESLHEKQQGSS